MTAQTISLFIFTFFVGVFDIFACSPGQKRTDLGLLISRDGGKTFAKRTTADGLESNSIREIFANGQSVYVVTSEGLSISNDGGKSFITKTIEDGLASDRIFGVFADGQNVYVATNKGLFISDDGGTWFPTHKTTSDGLGSNEVSAVFAEGQNVYVATYGGLSISRDGGTSFINKTVKDGLGSNHVTGAFVKGKTLYVTTWGSVLSPMPPVNGGLSISTDGGETFQNTSVDSEFGYNLLEGVVAFDQNVYVIKHNDVLVSFDAGTSFANLRHKFFFPIHAVFISPEHFYLSTAQGLFASHDGGKTFTDPASLRGGNKVEAIFADGQTLYIAPVKVEPGSSAVCRDWESKTGQRI